MNSLFKALGDPTRREILEMLNAKDLTAGEISEAFRISKPSISYHLDLLKQGGLVIAIKRGQYIYYSLNTSAVDETLKWFFKLLRK